jgi:hypothetical protein
MSHVCHGEVVIERIEARKLKLRSHHQSPNADTGADSIPMYIDVNTATSTKVNYTFQSIRFLVLNISCSRFVYSRRVYYRAIATSLATPLPPPGPTKLLAKKTDLLSYGSRVTFDIRQAQAFSLRATIG